MSTRQHRDSGLLDVLVPMFEADRATVGISVGPARAWPWRPREATRPRARARLGKVRGRGQMSNRRLVMRNDFIVIGPPGSGEDQGHPEGAGRAQAHRGEPVALRLARGQVGDPRAGARAVEAGRDRAEGRVVHRVWAGHGTDPRHRQRPAGLHADRSGHLPRVPEAGGPADPRGEGPSAAERLFGDGSEPGQWSRVSARSKAFADFGGPETQAVIKAFGVDKYGQPLFVPVAGKKDEDL
jgi:tungstate transport system substrate-binding protein